MSGKPEQILKKLVSIFQKRGGGQQKTILNRIIPVVILLIIVSVLIYLPQVIIDFTTDRQKIESQINMMVENAGYRLRYEASGVTAYSGFILYNVQLNHIEPNHEETKVMSAPQIIIRPGFSNLMRNRVRNPQIYIDQAVWYIPVKNVRRNLKLPEYLSHNLATIPELEIALRNNALQVTLEAGGYEKEIWNITNISGKLLHSADQSFTIAMEYKNLPWGRGEFKYSNPGCEQCRFPAGAIEGKIRDLPIGRLRWFVIDYRLYSGFINLDFTSNQASSDNPVNINSSGSLEKLVLLTNRPDENVFYSLDKASFKLQSDYSDHHWNHTYKGSWEGFKFDGDASFTSGEVFPDHLLFNLKQDTVFDSGLFLPGNYELSGLKSIGLKMVRPEKKSAPSALIDLSLQIEKGRLTNIDEKEIDFKIPRIDIQGKENTFNITGEIERIKNHWKIDIETLFQPERRVYRQYLQKEDTDRKRTFRELPITVFIWDMKGKISAEEFNPANYHYFFTSFEKRWDQKVKEGLAEGWRDSLLREREWFQRYLLNGKGEVAIEINKKTPLSETNPSIQPISGSLNINNNMLDISLNENSNTFKLVYDYRNNYPILKIDYDAILPGNAYYADWIRQDGIIDTFSDLQINYNFFSSGERISDLAENGRTNYLMAFNHAQFVPEHKQELWENIQLEFSRRGTKGWLSIYGTRPEQLLSGKGTWDLQRATPWELSHRIQNR